MKTLFRGGTLGASVLLRAGPPLGPEFAGGRRPRRHFRPPMSPRWRGPSWFRRVIAVAALWLADVIRRFAWRSLTVRAITPAEARRLLGTARIIQRWAVCVALEIKSRRTRP